MCHGGRYNIGVSLFLRKIIDILSNISLFVTLSHINHLTDDIWYTYYYKSKSHKNLFIKKKITNSRACGFANETAKMS